MKKLPLLEELMEYSHNQVKLEKLMKKYTGGCHCGKVRYEAETDLAKVLVCNCSHCHKKGLVLNFVSKDKFTLLTDKEEMVEYFFNKKSIRHLFCKTCGVQSYAEGVEFPQVALNVRCLEGAELENLTLTPFNGKDL